MRVNRFAGAEKIRTAWYARAVLVVVLGIVVLVPVAQAREPAWNYSPTGGEIGGISVSPKGDLIAVGAGKVLFFSQAGTLLGQEPFGTEVMMTADGKYTASVYFSTVYYFENPLPAGSAGQQKAKKLWEVELSEQVSSFDMNRDGSLIAGQTIGKNLFILNTKTRLAQGNTKVTDSAVKISGGGIIGMSAGKIHFYNSGGNLSRTEDVTTNSAPRFLVLPSGGSVVFSDGQAIRSVNAYNGTERWKRQLTGSVSALSMAPGGSLIVAGTEAGNVAGVAANGNLSWSYASNVENRQSAGITCSAVSDKGTTIAAGTADGKILFLDSRGELTGSYAAHEYIRHIAMSADGTVVAAAGDERVYIFLPGSASSLPVATPSRTLTGMPVKNTATPSPAQTPLTAPSVQTTTAAIPTELPTTYSIIRTATPSPPAFITLPVALALVMALFYRRR
jgi:outer membrane protein assembly factor BamB